jgi:hypothetical protein
MPKPTAEIPMERLKLAIQDLVCTAESDLPRPEKLEFLCVQVGTARFWLDQVEPPANDEHELAGPHFATTLQPSAGERSRSTRSDV